MKLAFSFAVALHQMFDSRPPRGQAEFYLDGYRQTPFYKPGGLAVFVDAQPGMLGIRCPGYLPQFRPVSGGEVAHVFLSPAAGLVPPAGYRVVDGAAAPGQVLCRVDDAYQITPVGRGKSPNEVFLRCRPGVSGGALLVGDGEQERLTFIVDKLPPNCFILDCPIQEILSVRRVYVAVADETGRWTAVVPEDEVKGGEEWEWVSYAGPCSNACLAWPLPH